MSFWEYANHKLKLFLYYKRTLTVGTPTKLKLRRGEKLSVTQRVTAPACRAVGWMRSAVFEC